MKSDVWNVTQSIKISARPFLDNRQFDKRSEWIGAMIQNYGIDKDYYRSKCREHISDLPSKKNKEFAEALKEILD